MRRGIVLPLALGFGLACGDDTAHVGADDGSTSESGDSSGSTSTEESGDSESTDESDDGTDTDTGEEQDCGNGELDYPEECDDGNEVDDDGCSNTCLSACGTDFAVNIAVEPEDDWFTVHQMLSTPDDSISLIGGVSGVFPDLGVGYARVADYMQNQPAGSIDGPPLGPAGSMDLPQTHVITGAQMDADGEVYVLGHSTQVMVVDESPVSSFWLARLDGGDLSETWRVPLSGDDPELFPRSLAIMSNGDPVVARSISLDTKDTDAWFGRFAAADGAEVWTANHSGQFNGGWSIDEGNFVAVDTGDRLWGLPLIRVDYETHEANLFELNANDGSLFNSTIPVQDIGNTVRHRPESLAAGQNGEVAIGITVFSIVSKYSHFYAYRYVHGQMEWELTREDLPWEDGDPYLNSKVSIDASGNTLVSGSYTHDFGFATAARGWTAKVSPTGELLCAARLGMGNNGAVIPSNGFFGGAGRAAVNLDTYGPGGMGPGSGANWLLGLRE